MPLPDPERRHRLRAAGTARPRPTLLAVTMVVRLPQLFIRQPDPTIRVDPAALVEAAEAAVTPVDRVARADPANIPVDLVVRAITPVDQVDLVVRAITPVDLVVRAITPVDLAITPVVQAITPVVQAITPVDRAITPVDRAITPVVPAITPVDLAAPGTETASVATSMARRGATDLALGGLVRHRDPHGTGRCLPREAGGMLARSTTTATRKPRSGIPGSTHGASGSSEFGSRCKDAVKYDARLANWRGGCRHFYGLKPC